MLGVVLTVVLVWLALSVLASAVCALIARGGLDEDRLRAHLREHAAEPAATVPWPR